MNLVIRGARTPDANFRNLRSVDILVEGDRIARIAGAGDLKIPSGAHVIEAAGQIAVPGMIDAHTHMYQTVLRGPLDDLHLTQWLAGLWAIEHQLDWDDVYTASMLGCLEAIRFGVTTVCDMTGTRYPDAIAQAIADSGLRGVVGLGVSDLAENPHTPTMSTDECVDRSVAFIDSWNGKADGRLTCAVAPRGLPSCSERLMSELKEVARAKNVPFHTHLAEGKSETEAVRQRTGKGEAEILAEQGVLDQSALLAHSIWVSQHELDLIKQANANPVHCPSTNMKIADGIAPVADMLDRGINVCLGCDGVASSASRDLIREAKLASLLQKLHRMDSAVLPAEQVWAMLTRNGARALGRSRELGLIAEGFLADITLIDPSGVHLVGEEYLMSNLIYSGTGADVVSVVVAGEVIFENGRFMKIDAEKAIIRGRSLMSRISLRS